MSRISGWLALAVGLCVFTADSSSGLSAEQALAPAEPFPLPFHVGERLTYDISWLAVKAGTATMEVREAAPARDQALLLLVNTAKSSRFLSTFFPVDNRVESYVDAGNLAPQHLIFHRREGKKRNEYDLTFLHSEGKVSGTKDGELYVGDIPPETHDALSCLYYFRTLPSFQPGASTVINVHHDKNNYRLETRIEGVERLNGPWGSAETVRVLVVVPFQGIFLNEGNLRVWITNDTRRLPVMMKAKVIIGSIVAKLIRQG
jgi:hypothetical protein